ncbi:hypothetical protein BKA65DRAFT_481051 [Rhexocercosporidium sp. MPI-PUGE-AT-0058]|nr:hypothetical protein BKA65DRAFT_481051 [Rhexocercosporidium sp. MPI-PUGE-AT-0058]
MKASTIICFLGALGYNVLVAGQWTKFNETAICDAPPDKPVGLDCFEKGPACGEPLDLPTARTRCTQSCGSLGWVTGVNHFHCAEIANNYLSWFLRVQSLDIPAPENIELVSGPLEKNLGNDERAREE